MNNELIKLLRQVKRMYQTRLGNGLTLVDEKRGDLAWGNGIWAKGQNRTHFRSHYPLLTAQSIWDNAADHFYQLGGRNFKIPESYNTSKVATNGIMNGDVIFMNHVCWRTWIDDVAPYVQATDNVTIVLFDGDRSFCKGSKQDALRDLAFVSDIFVSNACPHFKVTPMPLGLMDNLEFPKKFRSYS